MNFIGAILPLVLIVLVSAIVVRIAAVMLKMTGLDEKTARFQSLSAFTGTGFTTKDSELIVNHEKRRKIIMILMILGNAGFISVITTFLVSFLKEGSGVAGISLKMLAVVIILVTIYFITRQKRFARFINTQIEKRLESAKIMERRPLEEILNLAKGYGIAELHIKDDCKEAGMTLQEAGFNTKNILVLNIEKKDRIISSPKAMDVIDVGDTLICYGPLQSIKDYTF